jgi:hypothetical protein
MKPVLAIRQVSPQIGIAAGRILRRRYWAKRLTKRVTRPRTEQGAGPHHLPHDHHPKT